MSASLTRYRHALLAVAALLVILGCETEWAQVLACGDGHCTGFVDVPPTADADADPCLFTATVQGRSVTAYNLNWVALSGSGDVPAEESIQIIHTFGSSVEAASGLSPDDPSASPWTLTSDEVQCKTCLGGRYFILIDNPDGASCTDYRWISVELNYTETS